MTVALIATHPMEEIALGFVSGCNGENLKKSNNKKKISREYAEWWKQMYHAIRGKEKRNYGRSGIRNYTSPLIIITDYQFYQRALNMRRLMMIILAYPTRDIARSSWFYFSVWKASRWFDEGCFSDVDGI